jgi:hypothetical protein
LVYRFDEVEVDDREVRFFDAGTPQGDERTARTEIGGSSLSIEVLCLFILNFSRRVLAERQIADAIIECIAVTEVVGKISLSALA